MRLLHAAAVLIGGRRLELHIENIVQRRRVGLIDDDDAVAVAARLQRRGGGVRRQLGGDLLVDLRDGQTHPHGLVLVDRDVDLGVARVLPVGDVFDAVDALHQRHDLLARGGQIIEVVAVEVHLDAGAGQRTHVHHAIGVHFNFAVQICRFVVNFLLHDLGLGCLVAQQDVIGKRGVVGGGIAADHGDHAVGTARHRADGIDAVHRHDRVHDAVRRGEGVLLSRVVRHVDRDGQLVAVHVGDHDNAHGSDAPDRHPQQRNGQCQRHSLAAQAEAQQLFIAVQHLIKQRVPDVLLLFQHGGACAGHNGQRHNKGRHQAEGDGPGHVAEQLAHHAGGEHQRQKNADRRQGGGYDGPGHLTRALHRRAGGGHAAAPQTVDVFNDDNRVIDQHADAQREAGQRQDIEGNAGEIHQHNGKQHAQRHTDGHDDGRAQVL